MSGMGNPGHGSPNIGFTKEGGLWNKYVNKTGAASVKGTLVNTEGSIDNSVATVIADEPDIIGSIYEDGVPDGSLVKVVTSGKAQVLLEDGSISTRGYWGRISVTQDGRADITNVDPPGGTITAIDGHFKEIGHCLESKESGTDLLAWVHLHFN